MTDIINYTYSGRPACFVPKCSTCPYQSCCANAVPATPYYTTTTTGGMTQIEFAAPQHKCNGCVKE